MSLRDETQTCAHCGEATVELKNWNRFGWTNCVVPLPVRYFCPKEECQQAREVANRAGMKGDS